MNMIHAKLRHIIESNSSEEGVSSCSSVAGDEIHDSDVPGSFSWLRSEGETSLDALHCVGCESLLIPKRVQELPYRWVLAGYQRVEGVVVGLQGVGCPGRARGYGGLNNSIILRCVDYLQGCNLRWIGKVGVRFSVL